MREWCASTFGLAVAEVIENAPPCCLCGLRQSLEGIALEISDNQRVDRSRLDARCADVRDVCGYILALCQ